MTISNIISPLMVYMDGFVIASMLGVGAATYYVAPYEVITKFLVVPAAISGVLFLLFTKEWQTNPTRSGDLMKQGFSYTLLLLFPAAIVAVYFSKEWLSLWLSPEFALQEHLVVMWLTIGILINGVAHIVFAQVQGAGRSDWTAKLHLSEVLPYLGLLYISLYFWGIAGAAFAWSIRVAVDLCGLLIMSKKISPTTFKTIRPALWMLVISIGLCIPSIFTSSLAARSIEAGLFLLIYSWLAYQKLKSDGMLAKISDFLTLKREG